MGPGKDVRVPHRSEIRFGRVLWLLWERRGVA